MKIHTFSLFFADVEVYSDVKIDRLKSICKLLENSGEDLGDFFFMDNETLAVKPCSFFNLSNILPPTDNCTVLTAIAVINELS